MNFHVLTLFPEMINQGIRTSITGRAIEQGYIKLNTVQIRDFSKNKHHKVDDYPYGGGAGMLMQADVVYDAYESVAQSIPRNHSKRVIYVTPQGIPFHQGMAREFAKEDELIFLCGHYEGIDERVLEEVVTDYVSIGDYVLTGGELAAMVMIDAISRLVPGVLNNEVSAETESFHRDLLEYPQYSRPEIWHEKRVPEVLLSGNQKKIDAWRLEESIKRTKERRPDLYARYELMEELYAKLSKQKLLHIDMLERMKRGRASLVDFDEDNILLRDQPTGNLYYSCLNLETAKAFLDTVSDDVREATQTICIHQEELIPLVEQEFQVEFESGYRQMVYTQKEQLPVKGLYQADGKEIPGKIVIRPIGMEYFDFVQATYTTYGFTDYITDRLSSGEVFGAFLDGQITGFMGLHDDGSLGMLEVLPEFRGRKIGTALEVYLINYSLRMGHTPYGQVKETNEASWKLQESLGLYPSKTNIYWLSKSK